MNFRNLLLLLSLWPSPAFSTKLNEAGNQLELSSSAQGTLSSNLDLWRMFHDWAEEHGKVYSSVDEKISRMNIWLENHCKCLAFNLELVRN